MFERGGVELCCKGVSADEPALLLGATDHRELVDLVVDIGAGRSTPLEFLVHSSLARLADGLAETAASCTLCASANEAEPRHIYDYANEPAERTLCARDAERDGSSHYYWLLFAAGPATQTGEVEFEIFHLNPLTASVAPSKPMWLLVG